MIVLDASVAAKWFVVEDDSKAAIAVLDEIAERPEGFAVPELFFVEMLSVLARVQPDTAALCEHLADLEHLGIQRLAHGHEMLATAATLAHEHGLSGYDALYAACAKLLGGAWLTADVKAHRRLSRTTLTRLL